MKSDKIIFLLGAGASIASANKNIRETLGPLSMKNFKNVMIKMSPKNIENENKLRKLGYRFSNNDNVFVNSNSFIKELKKFSKIHKSNDITKLHKKAYENWKDCSFHFITDLEYNIFQTVSNYYNQFEEKYYKELYNIISLSNASVISLNWDINLERTIYSETEIDMKNYYGNTLFNALKNNNEKINPIVRILKPHGSLNQYFVGGRENPTEYEYQFYISNQSDYNFTNIDMPLLIPPFYEKYIPVLDKNNKGNDFMTYNKSKYKFLNGINEEIKKEVKMAKILIIIGYSFPPTDNHISELFEGNSLERIIVIDKDENVFNNISSMDFFEEINKKDKMFYNGGFKEIMNLTL